MLTLGNVHKVVPKGANSGLNGNSVQPTGVVPKRCFDPSPEYKFAVILWPSLEMISMVVKALILCLERTIAYNGWIRLRLHKMQFSASAGRQQ
jgi:hypothetical protein